MTEVPELPAGTPEQPRDQPGNDSLPTGTGRTRRPGRRNRASLRGRLRRGMVPWLFLAPALVIFTYFKFIPMIQGMWMSLYEVRPYLGNRFVGTRNYAEVVGNPQFQAAI